MKKLFKIIPLTCLATTVATVAPLMTSCAKDTKYIYDLMNEPAEPERVPYDGIKGLDRPIATKMYYDFIKQDPKRFISDYMYGRYRFIHSEIQRLHARVNAFTLSMTSPKFSTTTISYSHHPDITYPTLSCTVEGHLEIDLSPVSVTNKVKAVVDWKVKYKDAVFYVYNDLERGVASSWTVGMMDVADISMDSGASIAYLYTNKPWSIDMDYNCDVSTTYIDPVTGVQTTSTQNYNFDKKLSDYYSLNDTLAMAYGFLQYGDIDSFPLGILWYFIPMDFAAASFTYEGGEPYSSELGATFRSYIENWQVKRIENEYGLSITFPKMLFTTGCMKPEEGEDYEITLDLDDGITYWSYCDTYVYLNFDNANVTRHNNGTSDEPEYSNEYWDVTIECTNDAKPEWWEPLASYFEKAELDKLDFRYDAGLQPYIVITDPDAKETAISPSDNFIWKEEKTFNFTGFDWSEPTPP